MGKNYLKETNPPTPPCLALLISIKYFQSCHNFCLIQVESQSTHFPSSLILHTSWVSSQQ